MKKICFTIIDTLGDTHRVEVAPYAYRSLMEFLVNELLEEIGDCKGRAWCGTCIVKQISGRELINVDLERDEIVLLDKYPNPENAHIRLACQIQITGDLENTCWEVVDSRLEM